MLEIDPQTETRILKQCREIGRDAFNAIVRNRLGYRLPDHELAKLKKLLALFNDLGRQAGFALSKDPPTPPTLKSTELALARTRFFKSVEAYKCQVVESRFLEAKNVLSKMALGIPLAPDDMDDYPSLVVYCTALAEMGKNRP